MPTSYDYINWKVRSDPDKGRAHIGIYADQVILRVEDESSMGFVALDSYELDRFIRKLKRARREMRSMAADA